MVVDVVLVCLRLRWVLPVVPIRGESGDICVVDEVIYERVKINCCITYMRGNVKV